MINSLKSFHLLGPFNGDAHICPIKVPRVFFGNLSHAESTGHLADGLVATVCQTYGYLRPKWQIFIDTISLVLQLGPTIFHLTTNHDLVQGATNK